MKMDMIMEKNGITVGIRQEYTDIGRVYACYFVYRHGTYFHFVQKLARTHIPICSQRDLEEYIEGHTKLLAKVWRFNSKKRSKK